MAPNGLACWYLFLILAILSQLSCGSKKGDHSDSHPSSHMMMNHMDPRMSILFVLEDLKPGKNLSISLKEKVSNPLISPFLFKTKKEADSVPFSSKQLPIILRHFSFPQGSRNAQAVEDTLRGCERSPIKGETKFCATSLESMSEAMRRILGSKNDIQVLATKFEHPGKSSEEVRVREYRIARIPQPISAPKVVTCHVVPYPYVVMYCHTQEVGNRLYRIILQANNGEGVVEAIAVCHMDTSGWPPDHAWIRALGIQPGSAPVCHFLPTDSFSLVPSTSTFSSST